MQFYPTFKQFCAFLEIYSSSKSFMASVLSSKKEMAEIISTRSKWKTIPLYVLSFIPITIFWIIIGVFGLVMYGIIKGASSSSSSRNKYPSEKYRKVIKEGILWDSTEYHER